MMSLTRIALLLLVTLCLPARAEDADVELGVGLVCDTQQQVERFVAVFHGDVAAAAKAVNDEVNNPTACVVASMAFVRGDELGTTRSNEGTFQIFKILLVGVGTGSGMQAVTPSVYFSVAKVEEIEV
jgi:hypothetical protein